MKNKKIKIFILSCMTIASVGCTKYMKDDTNKNMVYEQTGQTLTQNILCKPVTDELYNVYSQNDDKLSIRLEELPSCENFKPNDIKYVSLWESIFVKPLAWIILKVGLLVKNFGISVILISILIRLLLLPLSKKTILQSENMKKAQPELSKLEKKYAGKNDQESMMAKSQEMMFIYKKYDINPTAGCLVSFIQLPVLFAFLEAINRVPAIFEGTLFNMNLGMTPTVGISQGNYIYLLLIVLILLSTFISFKYSMQSGPSETQSQMKTMMIMMIVMIGFASLSLPTALALYWIANNLFALIQNLIIKKLSLRRK